MNASTCVWLFFVGVTCLGWVLEPRGLVWLLGIAGMFWVNGFKGGREMPKNRLLDGERDDE